MSDQRERVSTDPGIGPPDLGDTASTLHALEVANDSEFEDPGAPVYCEPAALVAVSDYKTLEIETVKLSDDIDPRKLQTELRLPRTPNPPSCDSAWPPPETVVTSSQRPSELPGRKRTLLLLAVLSALALLVFWRGLAQRSAAHARAKSAATTSAATAPATIATRAKVAMRAAASPTAVAASPTAVATRTAVVAFAAASRPLPSSTTSARAGGASLAPPASGAPRTAPPAQRAMAKSSSGVAPASASVPVPVSVPLQKPKHTIY